MSFRIKKYLPYDITVFKASGIVKSGQITDALKLFYDDTADKPTKNTLWDLHEATLKSVDHWDAMWITQVASYLGHGRENGKTAIVVSDEYDFEISRVIATYAPIDLVIVGVFRTIEEAAEWFPMDPELIRVLTVL